MCRLLLAMLAAIVFSTFPLSEAYPQATPPKSATYQVDSTLKHGDVTIGAPRVVLRAGHYAMVTMEKSGGYSIRLTLGEEASSGTDRRVKVTSQIYLRVDDRWALVASPVLTMPVGQKTIFRLDPADATGKPFELTMTVTTTSRLR